MSKTIPIPTHCGYCGEKLKELIMLKDNQIWYCPKCYGPLK